MGPAQVSQFNTSYFEVQYNSTRLNHASVPAVLPSFDVVVTHRDSLVKCVDTEGAEHFLRCGTLGHGQGPGSTRRWGMGSGQAVRGSVVRSGMKGWLVSEIVHALVWALSTYYSRTAATALPENAIRTPGARPILSIEIYPVGCVR